MHFFAPGVLRLQTPSPTRQPSSANDPVAYARDRLRVTLTADQATILRHLTIPPCKVLVPSGHDVGKTFIAAVAINWWYDTWNPGLCITLGPKYDSLKDTVWAEVRLQRGRAGLRDDFIGPSAPEMRSSPEHWAKGITAIKDAAVAGRHRARMLFVLEEAGGIERVFWEVLKTMFDPSMGHGMLAIFNPTDTTSQAYIEDTAVDQADNPAWHRFRLNALAHPNLEAELNGRPKPVPGAVSVAMVDEWVRDWCEPVEVADHLATDVYWPPDAVCPCCRGKGEVPG